MTRYRVVERTWKHGSIKQHYDIDNIYYCQFGLQIDKIKYSFSTTTKTLEDGIEWLNREREIQKIELGWGRKTKITNNFKKKHEQPL